MPSSWRVRDLVDGQVRRVLPVLVDPGAAVSRLPAERRQAPNVDTGV